MRGTVVVRAEDVRAHLRFGPGGARLPLSVARKIGIETPPDGGSRRSPDPFDPQVRLTEALRQRLGHDVVQTEVCGLIPHRRYRADIVIPSARLVIEFDGFRFHRSKAAFQRDRERQNAFVAAQWRVLRFFHKQVRDDLDAVVDQIASVAGCTENGPQEGDA